MIILVVDTSTIGKTEGCCINRRIQRKNQKCNNKRNTKEISVFWITNTLELRFQSLKPPFYLEGCTAEACGTALKLLSEYRARLQLPAWCHWSHLLWTCCQQYTDEPDHATSGWSSHRTEWGSYRLRTG